MMRGLDEKGQTSLEMLLVIAGAIILVVIVALYLKNIVRTQLAPEANRLAHETVGKFD